MPHSLASARKLTAAVSLLLHLLVVGVVPFAEFSSDKPVHDDRVHVEASGDGPCLPLHDHLTCQYCRVLARDLLTARPGDIERVPAPVVHVAAVDATPQVPDDIVRSSLLPRAPPLV